MYFTLESSQNLLAIGFSEIGSYFRFRRPLAVSWYDCRGSVGQYLCLLPYSAEYRETVRQKINAGLDTDYSENIAGLYELLQPLFPLFRNGRYKLGFEKPYAAQNIPGGSHVDFLFSEPVIAANADEKKAAHKAYLKSNKSPYPADLLEYTTGNFYDGASTCYIATQPETAIDEERVRFFEEAIKNGKRPFAIIANADFSYQVSNGDQSVTQYTLGSVYYVLDGHHKLLAYQRLRIQPPLAFITYCPETREEVEFDVEALVDALYPWQLQHLIDHWDERDSYLQEQYKNPASKVHRVIRNGLFREYHDNGKLKHEAFYNNHRIEGVSRNWYENGRMKDEFFYTGNKRSGTWRQWYPSGKMKFIHSFDDKGQLHGEMTAWHENGRKWREEHYDHGKNSDGYSYTVWYPDGAVDSILQFRDGRMTERKNFAQDGRVTNLEVYDEALQRLVKKK